uniref:GRAM domain-containing protein n=1 Tax=Oryza brachyantha TaxID=4533 RepID=J3LK64_ORYBR
MHITIECPDSDGRVTNMFMVYRTLGRGVDELVSDFELGLKTAAVDNYSRRLVEFCSLQALQIITSVDIGDKIHDGSFSRFTFDMMLAWETPTPSDQQVTMESIAKEREDRKEPLQANEAVMGDETSLFYSDMMPLLVNEEPTVGEDTYVWFGSVFPLACDVINARFTFEALTATTANRLHYPAYDKFLKEMDKSSDFLRKVSAPTGTDLAEDEFILHMEGTAGTQRVVRHIGTTSWPGRLILTNKALYFEASGKISYEPALKVELSGSEMEKHVKTTSTGPFGAPLFDKGIEFELPEPLVLEFPEMTSSIRRDMWLTLIREVIFLHRFISMYNIDSPIHKWELHSRIILGVIRLHAAREMLRMSPPPPSSFLVFSLYEELPKGDFVLEQLANNLKETSTITPLSASHVFKGLSKSNRAALIAEIAIEHDKDSSSHEEPLASLENTIGQVRDEAREVTVANAAIEGMKEEGITDSLLVLVGLVSPISKLLPVIQKITSWERPLVTIGVLAMIVLTIYKEWVGFVLAASLILAAGLMIWARKRKIGALCSEVIIDTSSDKTTMQSLVEAQQSLRKVHDYIKTTNVVILRLSSIVLARSPKHTETVVWMLTALAVALAVIPFKFVLIALKRVFHTAILFRYKHLKNGRARYMEWNTLLDVVCLRENSANVS